MFASRFETPDYFFVGGQHWQNVTMFWFPLSWLLSSTVHYLFLLCPLLSYLLNITGTWCWCSKVQMNAVQVQWIEHDGSYRRLHAHLEEVTPTCHLQLTVMGALCNGLKEQEMLMTLKEPIVLQPKLHGLGHLDLKSGNYLAPAILLSRFLRVYLHSKYLFCWIRIQLLMSSVFNSWCCHLDVQFILLAFGCCSSLAQM